MRKGYWNDELNDLKSDSIAAHNFWNSNGRPRVGPIFEAKKNTYYRYKLRVRADKRNFNQDRADSLNVDLLDGDHHKFWKSFKHFNYCKSSQSTHIDGLSDDNLISNRFADMYKAVYESCNKDASNALHALFQSDYHKYCHERSGDSISHLLVSWQDMLDVMSKLKPGKATCSFLKPEHILFGSPKLVCHLHVLFNAMIQHSYVPHEFLHGVVTPLLKDSEGNSSDPCNYRPLTLSVVFSNLFEHALLLKIGHLLITDPLQFGYKKRHSTSHAIYTLRTCIDYFTSHGSHVFTAFLDCSKGFDKVNHCGIFLKLMQRGIPLCILKLIMYWYSNLTSLVKWNNVLSSSFRVPSGVRQGGVLSPHLFAIYMDDLIADLRKLKHGCFISNLFLACIVYADDICLLAPCRSALQSLLDACESYADKWCLTYNPSKSKIMSFGTQQISPSFQMYGKKLDAVTEYKYLGVKVEAGASFSISLSRPLIRFRSSANTILNAPYASSEPVLMKLLYAICIPHLTYASEVMTFSSRQVNPLTVAHNDCIRRIFGYNRWESVRFLRLSLGYPSLIDIFWSRRRKFHARLPSLGNDTLNQLIALNLA